MKPPSERELQRVERKLQQLNPGAQKTVGGGIYMRLDSAGRRRFQFRLRSNSSSQPGGTYDSWQEAVDARTLREAADAAPEEGVAGPSATAVRDWEVTKYGEEAWWPDVLLHLDLLTQLDYRRGWQDLKPHIRGITLADLESAPLLIDKIKRAIAKAKTYSPKPGETPKLHPAAADKPLKILSIISSHALDRQIIVRNPMAGVKRFNTRRRAAESPNAPSHRPVLESEIQLPETAALAGAGMRGDPLTIERRRLIPELIVAGWRPSDILGMRNRSWRDKNGPKRLAHLNAAVKDLAGHLIEGEPKTGPRDIHVFDSIAEQLERIYQLEGSGDLDALTFPNANGGLLDWGNWRQQTWYPALDRAKISEGCGAKTRGAFYPYMLRHVGATIMLHAARPEGGTYARDEVARQFGHTVGTLDRVYASIPKNMHGIAGKTMDEIIRDARRQIWGPMPGDADYAEIEYDLIEAGELTGISRNALAARIQRGSIPGIKRGGKCYVTHFDLAWHGLIPRGIDRTL